MAVVELEHTPAGFTVRTGHPLLGDIHADFSTVGPSGRAGTARALLVGACLNCFCGTLNAALLARDVQYTRILGRGTAVKEEKDGISWITKIEIEVDVEAAEEDAETVDHCIKIVKGCMITRSVMEGVEVTAHARRI